MKFVVLLDEAKVHSGVDYPVKILQNYLTIGKPEQIVVFEAKSEMELKLFEKVFKDTNYQIFPVVDEQEYSKKEAETFSQS